MRKLVAFWKEKWATKSPGQAGDACFPWGRLLFSCEAHQPSWAPGEVLLQLSASTWAGGSAFGK